MKNLSIGDPVPTLSFDSTDPNIHSFQDLLGKNIVVYFYPKDNTPGCTTEGREFALLYEKFLELNTIVLGISKDSLKSHHRFCEKLQLPFPLISDPDKKLCDSFGVLIGDNWVLSKLLTVERSTFLINERGVVQYCWRKVKAKGHAEAVLNYIKSV